MGRGGRGVWDLAAYLPDEAPGRVVVCSSSVKSRSCVSGVQRCTCGLSKLLNKRNSSLAGVSAAVPMARCGDVAGGICRGDGKGSGGGSPQGRVTAPSLHPREPAHRGLILPKPLRKTAGEGWGDPVGQGWGRESFLGLQPKPRHLGVAPGTRTEGGGRSKRQGDPLPAACADGQSIEQCPQPLVSGRVLPTPRPALPQARTEPGGDGWVPGVGDRGLAPVAGRTGQGWGKHSGLCVQGQSLSGVWGCRGLYRCLGTHHARTRIWDPQQPRMSLHQPRGGGHLCPLPLTSIPANCR